MSKTRRDVSPRHADGAFAEMAFPPWALTLFHAALITLLGFWIYSPCFTGDWLWDDDTYITKNPLLADPNGLWKEWFAPGSFMEYYPIEQTVTWCQWQLWHNDTLGYHLTNVALHVVNALLVWRLLAKLRVPLAWIGGLLFVAHPVQVESVAWIVELKNTLSAAPFLLALCAWIDFEDRRRPRDYFLALGFFLVAMLCKVSMITFPFVILLYAWWKRGRMGLRDLLASAPFFLVSVVLAKVAMYSAVKYALGTQTGANNMLAIGGTATQLALAGLAIAFYFSNVILPFGLLPIYPVWPVNPPSPAQFLPWLVIAGVLGVLWWKRTSWGRHALLGLGFFVLLLGPCLSFGFLFFPRDAWVMNHFLYLPAIGLIGLATAAIGHIDAGLSTQHRTYVTGAVTILVALLAFEAHAYASAFTNPETLWTYTLERNPGSWTAHLNLGLALEQDNDPAGAESHFRAALQLKPDDATASVNLGELLAQTGRMQEGIAELRRALLLSPYDAAIRNNLGVALAQTGKMDEAQQEFEQAVKLQPNYADPYNNLGNIAFNAGRLDDAERMYRREIELRPGFAQTHLNLGLVLEKMGRTADARAEFAATLQLQPDNAAAQQHYAASLQAGGHP